MGHSCYFSFNQLSLLLLRICTETVTILVVDPGGGGGGAGDTSPLSVQFFSFS